MPLLLRERNLNFARTERVTGARKTYQWTTANIERVRSEPYAADSKPPIAVRDVNTIAVVIQELAAMRAQLRLERTCGVVNASVDDFAVARAGLGAKGVTGLQYQHLAPRQRQCTGYCQPHHAGAHHHTIHLLHAGA